MGYEWSQCPIAETLYAKLTNTPMNISISDSQVNYMVESMHHTVEKLRVGIREPVMKYKALA
jgi:hypothetical protein